MLDDIELALSKGKIEGAKVLLKEYFYKELTTNKIPCNTCDTIIDDETCPECNGTGYVEGNKTIYPADKEVELKTNEYLASKYVELRKSEYPPIEEQLDMQFKDSINGTTKWADLITSIKSKYPKVV
ncbi:hypothetical protein [Arcobacter roscoffensis]|uniref:Uncharacterized protein n=1 Tax=Arcobacter roscoffensis TaxID=2961520 RepID=A0ABY5DZJ8_9BACT|nr:hypothetical protein [Arcobacter roscoffensis]UTJ05384.1 hypothetical protein NJU99_08895 [Arcobacter roscoffensis]